MLDQQTDLPEHTVPVGYAIEDKEILLLDDNRQPVGVNEIGEIAIKSRYLSPGYWRQPEITDLVFLPDPDGGDERIYLSGDMGRMSADGCLEHLGRKDAMVKIRGQRVEIGAIEMALCALDNIKEAVVMARESPQGENVLVAYVVPETQPAPTAAIVRYALANRLPDYMIPTWRVPLKNLPRLPNGKIGRQSLPQPDWQNPQVETPYIAPRTELERQLTAIYRNILGVETIGAQDNFFELGGHSLSAGQILAEVSALSGKHLPLTAMFQYPTVEQLAEVLRQEQWQPQWKSLIPVHTGGSGRPLFFVHGGAWMTLQQVL
ncbi:MAG: AMP-binding protein [bacterium]|nr:AMP-binding protein [bacterium]